MGGGEMGGGKAGGGPGGGVVSVTVRLRRLFSSVVSCWAGGRGKVRDMAGEDDGKETGGYASLNADESELPIPRAIVGRSDWTDMRGVECEWTRCLSAREGRRRPPASCWDLRFASKRGASWPVMTSMPRRKGSCSGASA